MKIVFIGCVQFSLSALEFLLNLNEVEVSGIVSKSISNINSDHVSLIELANEKRIPSFDYSSDNKKQLGPWIQEQSPDIVYCFGWSHLLKSDVLNIPPRGVVGYHPAALPQNRGRHPLIWALVLGLEETASTFFLMDDGLDSGDILDQKVLPISEKDDATSLYQKMTNLAMVQIKSFSRKLSNGECELIKQDQNQANSWRKRSQKDGEIDWRMPAKSIHNLIRALTKPYPGAHFVYNEQDIRVWKSRIGENSKHNWEPGKVLSVGEPNQIEVQCGDGSLVLIEHELSKNIKVHDYL